MDNPVFLSQNVLSNAEGISLTVSLSEDVTIRILRADKRTPPASAPFAPGLVSHARWRCQGGDAAQAIGWTRMMREEGRSSRGGVDKGAGRGGGGGKEPRGRCARREAEGAAALPQYH